MVKTLRSEPAGIEIEYANGSRTSLVASHFVLYADHEQVSISFQQSSDQRAANKKSRHFNDVDEPMENLRALKIFDFDTEKWLSPLIKSLNEFPNARHETAINFSDGSIGSFHGAFVHLLTKVQFVIG